MSKGRSPAALGVPLTHHVDPIQAMETLDHDEMVQLARLFQKWALNEEKLHPDQRTKLMLWSADYEEIAHFCGRSWKPTSRSSSIDAIAFLAKHGFGPPLVSRARRRDPRSVLALLEQLATRVEAIVAADDDPAALMEEILSEAEMAGIHAEPWTVRRDALDKFTMDLLTENPSAYEWLQFAREWMDPAQIRNRDDLLDVLAASTGT